MYTIHGTAKLLKRVVDQPIKAPIEPTTRMGDWYATMLAWRPQVALFVNETTRLPVFVPLAPAKNVAARFPIELATVLTKLGAPAGFVDAELDSMGSVSWAKTANRSVIGSMTDFAFLAEHHRTNHGTPDLVELSVRLSRTPCSPLYKTHGSPDREVIALTKKMEGPTDDRDHG